MKGSWRNRYDRIYLKHLDGMHVMMPMMMPRRCDNEAVATEIIDIEAISEYIKKKNAENPSFKYTWFHVICAALAKVLILRPKMNRFISGNGIYSHRDVTVSFLVKKILAEEGEEACAKVAVKPGDGSPVEQIHDYVEKFVTMIRKEHKEDRTSDSFNILKKFPLFFLHFLFWFLSKLDRWGLYPQSAAEQNPCFSSIFISNIGSIGMNADYHHLFETGSLSIFVLIGKMQKRPVFNDDGTYQMRDTIKLSLTLDERIADGFYFGTSIKLLRHLLQHPELLDEDVSKPVEIEK